MVQMKIVAAARIFYRYFTEIVNTSSYTHFFYNFLCLDILLYIPPKIVTSVFNPFGH